MILPFPIPQISDEERLKVLILKQASEIEQQKVLIEQLKKIDKDKNESY